MHSDVNPDSRPQAWRIAEADLEIGRELAAGAAGTVHVGRYAGHTVAVKVLKQPLDPELNPDVAVDFVRQLSDIPFGNLSRISQLCRPPKAPTPLS